MTGSSGKKGYCAQRIYERNLVKNKKLKIGSVKEHLKAYFGLNDSTLQRIYSYILGHHFIPGETTTKKLLFKEIHEKSQAYCLSKERDLKKFVTYVLKRIIETIKKFKPDSLTLPPLIEDSGGSNSRGVYEDFYQTEEWQQIRRVVVKTFGCKCMRCGAVGLVHVDHVKPRSKFPALELDITNMQVLCEACNNHKGTKHGKVWDFRTSRQKEKLKSLCSAVA